VTPTIGAFAELYAGAMTSLSLQEQSLQRAHFWYSYNLFSFVLISHLLMAGNAHQVDSQ